MSDGDERNLWDIDPQDAIIRDSGVHRRGWSVGQWISAGVFLIVVSVILFVVYSEAVGQVPFQ